MGRLAVSEGGGTVVTSHAAMRRFRAEGQIWTVYELPHVALVFEGAFEERHVCGYPENWRSLDDEELYNLSGGVADR